MRIKQIVGIGKACMDSGHKGEANISRQMRWMMHMQFDGNNNHRHTHVTTPGIEYT